MCFISVKSCYQGFNNLFVFFLDDVKGDGEEKLSSRTECTHSLVEASVEIPIIRAWEGEASPLEARGMSLGFT